jgi:type II secretory pathway component PulF
MVEVGEKSGNLDDVFQLLAQHFERENEFRQELRRATMYPRFLFAFAIVLILIVAFVMPVVMEKLLRAKGETEPFVAAHYGAATQKMLPIATLIALGFLGWAVWRFLTRQPIFVPLMETIRLSLPWVGNLPRLLAASRFARALAMMVGAGMELSRSVELAADAAGSPQLQTAARQHAPRLQKGEPLSAVLMDLPLLHPMVVRIVATGEKTGTIDEGLTKAAEFLESEALTAIRAQAVAAYFVCFFLAAIAIFLAVARFWLHWYGGMVEAVDKFMGVDQ